MSYNPCSEIVFKVLVLADKVEDLFLEYTYRITIMASTTAATTYCEYKVIVDAMMLLSSHPNNS